MKEGKKKKQKTKTMMMMMMKKKIRKAQRQKRKKMEMLSVKKATTNKARIRASYQMPTSFKIKDKGSRCSATRH